MYEMNKCSPFWETVPQTQFNIHLTRILLITTLLILSLLYLIIFLIFKISINKIKSQSTSEELLETKKAQYQKWDSEYMLMFGDHLVVLAFVLSFSPYQFQLVLAILHFLFRAIYEVRLHKYNHRLKPVKTILRIINMALLICSMVGLSRTQFEGTECRDSYYHLNNI